MADPRRVGHAIRRRMGAPTSHLEAANNVITTQRVNNDIVASSPAGTSVLGLSTSPSRMQVPNNPDLEERASHHTYAASSHAAMYGLEDFQHVTRHSPDAAIYPEDTNNV